MATLNGRISVSAGFSQSVPNVPTQNGQAPAVTVPVSATFAPTSGTAADQIDLKYTTTLTFVASTPQVLNLQSLTDILGGAIVFARVKSITIKLHGAADGVVLKLGYAGTTANSWTSLVSNPGQIFLQAAPTTANDAVLVVTAPNATGYAVGSSNRLLNLDPGSAAFTADIEITGCSA